MTPLLLLGCFFVDVVVAAGTVVVVVGMGVVVEVERSETVVVPDFAIRLAHPDTAAARKTPRGRRECAARPGIARGAAPAAATVSRLPIPLLSGHPSVPNT